MFQPQRQVANATGKQALISLGLFILFWLILAIHAISQSPGG